MSETIQHLIEDVQGLARDIDGQPEKPASADLRLTSALLVTRRQVLTPRVVPLALSEVVRLNTPLAQMAAEPTTPTYKRSGWRQRWRSTYVPIWRPGWM